MRWGIDLAAEYAMRLREARERVACRSPGTALTDSDTQALPPPVRRSLHVSGAVGQAPVRCFHITYDATMFQRPGGKPFAGPAEQFNAVAPTMRRLFYMPSRLFGLPMAVLHDYEGSDASMRVRVARLVDAVDQRGAELARTETVTLLNDLCFWAPSSLVGPQFTWTAIDDMRAAVSFANGPHRVSAELVFDRHGDLVDFVSDDRALMRKDGTLQRLRWSTPMQDHQAIAGRRVPMRGEAIWHRADGPFVYGRFAVRRIAFDLDALSAAP